MFRLGFPNLFSLLAILILAVNYFGIMTDLDWTWQIRTGELIVQNGTPRNADTFTYTIDGVLVHDFEWLYEVILYGAWSLFGLAGLKLLKMLVVAAPFALLGWRLHVEGVRWRGIVVSFLVAMLVVSGAWNLRPLYCTTIGLLIAAGWLRDHCLGRKPLSVWLIAVMLLWSNLHPGVIAGQGLLLGAIGWEWINHWWRINAPLSRPALWRLTVIAGLGFLATFLSPDPIDRLLYPFRPELKHPVQQLFVEMQPLYAMFSRLPVATLLAYSLAGMVLWLTVVRFQSFRGWELALLMGLAFLANVAVRVLPDWTWIMLALGVPALKDWLKENALHFRRATLGRCFLHADLLAKNLLESRLFRWQPGWPLAASLGLLVLTLIPPLANALPVRHSSEWPVAALDHAEKLGLKGRFFGTPDNGAYVAWRLKDDARVYTDTRGFFFPPQLLEDSLYLPRMGADWNDRLERVLKEYRTDYFVLDAVGPTGSFWNALKPYVDQPLFQDARAVILSADQVSAAVKHLQCAQARR